MAQHTAGRLKQQNKKHKAPGGTRPSRENAVSGRTAGKEARSTTKQRTTNNQTWLALFTSELLHRLMLAIVTNKIG